MSLVTILWSMGAAAALMLGVLYGATWVLERRLVANLLFSLTAFAVAACARCELGMMHAATPGEFGDWVRWYHVPLFFAFLWQLLFVRFYLGAGRWWLLWTVLVMRGIYLVVDLLVRPNVFFREIYSLRRVPFLGEQVAVVGDAVLRPWFMFGRFSLFLALLWVIDASVQRWRRGDAESRHKALIVFAAVLGPALIATVLTQLAVTGLTSLPYLDTPTFLITLILMAFELSRDIMVSSRVQLELTELRANLVQVGRVSIMGQLAAALAHELNQPLGAILRNAEAAEMHLDTEKPDLEELRSIVADIRKDDRRAGDIIERMRALIKRRTVDMQSLAIDDVVQNVISLAHSEAASRQVLLTYATQPGLPRVSADRVHISQVLLNLVVNGLEAVQARPVGGRRVLIEARADPRQVEVTVRDSGPGIPPSDLNRIFEPLYSTKSGGLGMGLAICRTIIEAHGGRLWAEPNTAGSGATFRFVLPRAREAPA